MIDAQIELKDAKPLGIMEDLEKQTQQLVREIAIIIDGMDVEVVIAAFGIINDFILDKLREKSNQ